MITGKSETENEKRNDSSRVFFRNADVTFLI